MTMTMDHSPQAFGYQPSRYAGVPLKRGIAWVIDVGLIAIICTLILPFTAFTGIFFFPLMMLVVGFIYRWFTLAGGSATWGMRLMGISFRDVTGDHLSSGVALAHTIGYTISITIPPLQLISIVLILVTSRGQSLTDMVLGTVAMNNGR